MNSSDIYKYEREFMSLLSTKPGLFMIFDFSIPSRQATRLLV